MTQFERSILEMIARDEAVEATADRICLRGGSAANGVLCSMVTVDRAGRLHPLAGPGLPDEYSAAIDGIPIGPEVGSCGSAAFLREAVAVTDIFTDHRWGPYRALAEPLGYRACWSSPILGSDGRALGAFGFYYRHSRGPSRDEKRLVAECAGLSAILLDRRELRSDNYRLAYVDALSGLGNRVSFERALQQAWHGIGQVGLLLADIDGLKRINDDFGYATGDLLIHGIGQRLRGVARHARAFRIATGEFAVLLDGHDVEPRMSGVVEQIRAALRDPVRCGRHVISPSVTCGGATVEPLLIRDPAILRRQADLALRHAKETVRGGFMPFEARLAAPALRRAQAVQTATRALAEDRLEAHYQPIVRLGTRDVIGLEALCRLRTPQGKIVPAEQMTQAARSPSSASLVTDRMLALVAGDIRNWLDRGIALQHVSVNLSMADFRRRDLRERVMAAFSRHAVPLDRVVLEVTETVDLDDGDSTVIDTIRQLRAEGLLVALDDFGTGYASLTHLLDIPVDIVKTDKSLMKRLSSGDAGEVLIKALLEMVEGLGMQLLVEGVETSAQAAQLERLGCKLAQGFFFGRPRTAAATTEMLLISPPAEAPMR